MKKSVKLTSSIITAGALFLTNAPLSDIVNANEVPAIAIKTNENVSAKLVEKSGKYIVEVTAEKAVYNVKVDITVGKQLNTFTFNELKAGVTEEFELVFPEETESKEKALPKTALVKGEEVSFLTQVNGYNTKVVVNYEVEEGYKGTLEDFRKPEEKTTKVDLVVNPTEAVKEETTEPAVETPVTETGENTAKDSTEIVHTNPVLPNEEEKTSDVVELTVEELGAIKAAEAKEVEIIPEPTNVSGVEKDPVILVEPVSLAPDVDAPYYIEENPKDDAPKEVAPEETPVATPALGKEIVITNVYTRSAPETSSAYQLDESVAAEVLRLTNAHRVANGLPAFVAIADSSVIAGTEVRAQELASQSISGDSRLFSHIRPNGTTWSTAFVAGTVRGENLAINSSAQALVNWWKNSQAHNAAMLNPQHTKISVKVVKVGATYYAVQIFA